MGGRSIKKTENATRINSSLGTKLGLGAEPTNASDEQYKNAPNSDNTLSLGHVPRETYFVKR